MRTPAGGRRVSRTSQGTRRLWALGLVVALCAQVLVLGAGPVQAANPGQRDASFGTDGLVRTDLGGVEAGKGLVALPDGKLIVAGHAGGDFLLLRYLANGALDPTFGTDGKVITDLGGQDQANALVRRPNGNLIVAVTSCVNDNCNIAVAGYGPDGSLDPAFGTGGVVKTDLGGALDAAKAVALQPDGKVIIAGRRGFEHSFPEPPTNDDDFALVRYTATGTPDPLFGASEPSSDDDGVVLTNFGGDGDDAEDVVVQRDGMVVIAGTACSRSIYGPCDSSSFAIARYSIEGLPDLAFGTGGRAMTAMTAVPLFTAAHALVLQPDGKLVVAGHASLSAKPQDSPPVRANQDALLVRYSPDGSLDESFGTGGIVFTDFTPGEPPPGGVTTPVFRALNSGENYDSAKSLALQPDGKLVVLAETIRRLGQGGTDPQPPQFALGRYLPDGAPDISFGTGGQVIGTETAAEAGDLVILPGGRLVHTGALGNDVALARYIGDPIPSIESVEGNQTSPVHGNDSTPTIVVGGLTPGHTLKLYDGTREAASKPVSAESMTLNVAETDRDVVLTGEGEHVLSVRASSPSGQLSPVTSGFSYILNSTLVVPSLTIDDVQVTEGDSGKTEAVFTVRRSATSDQLTTVGFTSADGTASSGEDYEAVSGVLSFGRGETTMAVTVPVVGDTKAEAHEHFFVRLTEAQNATLANTEGRGIIIDDDRPEPVVRALTPASGPTSGGTKVIINGLRLSGTKSVQFGALQATGLTVVSDTELSVVAPRQPQGEVEVVVTTDGGDSDDFFDTTFTYGSGTWAETPSSMARPREHHSATALDGPACRRREPAKYCGKVLIVGGRALGHPLSEPEIASELYDPANRTFAPTRTPSLPRVSHTATLLDGAECHTPSPPLYCGKVLVAGGGIVEDFPEDYPDDYTFRLGRNNRPDGGKKQRVFALAELYDPLLETWSPAGTLNVARFDHSATLLEGPACQTPNPARHCGMVLVAGGTDDYWGHPPIASAELYDPRTNTWVKTAGLDSCSPTALCRGRSLHTATLLASGEVLVVAGLSGEGVREHFKSHILASALIYDPVRDGGSWRAVADELAVERFSHTATPIVGPGCSSAAPPPLCGTVIIAGGISGMVTSHGRPIYTSDVVAFDPKAGKWTTMGQMGTARGGHSASPLADGRILVAGANSTVDETDANANPSAEVFDPGSGTWRYTDTMATARGVHTATVLDGPGCREPGERLEPWCGSVLVAAGATVGEESTPPNLVASAEVYTPAPRLGAVTPGLGRGSGGTEVRIDGWGFTEGVNAVSFGGVPATSFAVEPGGRIKAVAPPHVAGPVEVAVVNGGGTSAAMSPEPASRFVYAGPPGAITDLLATPAPAAVTLSFTSPDDGTTLAPATRYVIKQSTSPIEADAGFADATALCGGVCSFKAGTTVELAIADLDPETTYYYAVQALNPLGEPGPIARVSTTTLGSVSAGKAATVCGPSPGAGPGQVAYPGGRYSLVGLPPASVLGTNAPLYSWINQGAGGSYSTLPGGIQLEAGHGYWAWFACDGVATLGAGQSSATMPLGAYHASMVGNPSASGPAVVSGHDFAARWDPNANAGTGGYAISGYREAQGLALGEATWVFSYVPTTVAINASP